MHVCTLHYRGCEAVKGSQTQLGTFLHHVGSPGAGRHHTASDLDTVQLPGLKAYTYSKDPVTNFKQGPAVCLPRLLKDV